MPAVNPILNHPYEPARRHYHTAADGSLDYGRILDGRRVYRPDMPVLPVGSGPQGDFGEWLTDDACQAHLIYLLRREVGRGALAAISNRPHQPASRGSCWTSGLIRPVRRNGGCFSPSARR